MHVRELSNTAAIMFSFFIAISLSFCVGIAGGQVNSEDTNRYVNPNEALEAKASLLNTDDAQSIRAFTDQVFSFPRAFPRMPQSLEDSVKDRIVRAQIAYRHGANQGVREQDIVELVNSLADRFAAPAYAKTSLPQVRVLRMWLAVSSPTFMGAGLGHGNMHVGESVNQRMSPLQAVHLLNSLIDQKFINPDYQVEPSEWERGRLQSSLNTVQRAADLHAALASARLQNKPVSQKGELQVLNRKRDLYETVSKHVAPLSLPETMDLIDRAFKTLGLE